MPKVKLPADWILPPAWLSTVCAFRLPCLPTAVLKITAPALVTLPATFKEPPWFACQVPLLFKLPKLAVCPA